MQTVVIRYAQKHGTRHRLKLARMAWAMMAKGERKGTNCTGPLRFALKRAQEWATKSRQQRPERTVGEGLHYEMQIGSIP